ncbi:solute carrier family 22 member 21 [Helicoverpa armigera]|uniref:solute carrier family 22 member 21 n=1 Tax=Helicoverpa armigera TaxID=29058 RepID=UPI003083A68F
MDSVYDRAISEVGQDGTFQIQFDIFYNIILAGLWSMTFNNIVLALTITPHMCKIPKKLSNESEHSWKLKYIPTVEDAAGNNKFSDCLVYSNRGNNITEECNIYDYDRTWFETTVPSDNDWVCENEIYVANIFAYSKIGETVGSLFFGWFGDVYGRKPTYVISLAMLIIGRFLSVLASSSFIIFAIGCVIAALPSWCVTQSASIVSLEISSPKRRANIAKLRLVATSFGLCLMPLLYWWLRSWKVFVVITTATQLPYLFWSWNFIESPQWLWVNGQFKKCVQVLKLIAKVNKTTLGATTENDILTSDLSTTNNAEVLGPLALFSGWRLAVNTILQLLLWIAVSVNYTVVLLSSAEKSLANPFLDFAWQSLAEIPGYFVASWLADRIGRRFTGVISTALTTLLWVVYAYRDIYNIGWLKNPWLGTALVIIIRFVITMSYYIINLFNMELYPTCLRQSGMSLGNVVSGGAGAVAPYILYLGRRFDARYPSVILIVTTLFGGVLTSYLLPETLNVKLPETLEDAQKFGRRDRSHYMTVNLKDETIESNIAVSLNRI